MPPKKKKDKKKVEKVEPYNVEVMSIGELKEYVNMLEKDIETLRNYMTFHQKSEERLADVNMRRQEELKLKEKQILAKDIEMGKLAVSVQHKVKEKRQWPKYDEFVNEQRVDRLASQTAVELEKDVQHHQDKKQQLNAKMTEKETELEAEAKKIQMGRMAAMKKNSKRLKDMDRHERDLLEKSIKAFVAMLEEGSQMNRLALKNIQTEALGNRRRTEEQFRTDCRSYREKLHEYYKQITRNDLKVIKETENKLKTLEKDIQAKQLQLQQIQKRNALLKTISYQKSSNRYKFVRSKTNSKTKLKLQKDTEISQLKKENALLLEQIQNIEKETVQLRRNFTQSLYKVRQSAEMKTVFLEKKLQSALKSEVTTKNNLSFKSNDLGK
ncbi:GAS domain-containing protein [Trichonephila clavata]|uniref:GAS domain-containing protein n=1 Tax=Trichonephila clavata TaxID=2740835 RepID=A0A8X6LA46_TRICU|nr:GAS domain-containing protein [Trichonephila clavata]